MPATTNATNSDAAPGLGTRSHQLPNDCIGCTSLRGADMGLTCYGNVTLQHYRLNEPLSDSPIWGDSAGQ
jgi:hypothetical protein